MFRRAPQLAIKQFSPYKSPGVDGIYPALLQEGLAELTPFLLSIIRSSLALGHIPRLWARAKIIFIPKQGKKDKTDPKAHKPDFLYPKSNGENCR